MPEANETQPITSWSTTMLGDQFKTRDPSSPIAPLDEARVEVLLKCFDGPQLIIENALQDFVRSLHQATWGNPDIFPLLIIALQRWQEFDNARARAVLKFLWDSFDDTISESSDGLTALRAYCTAPVYRFPPSIVHAIFDDRSLDFYAFIKWHGPLLPYEVSDDK